MTHGNVKLCDECMAELLMWLDRKTENSSVFPNNCEVECEKCKHFREEADTYMKQCEYYFMECRFEPKDEPTISKMEQVDKDINVRSKDEPQTDWHYDEQDATWYPYKHEDEPQTCDTCKYGGDKHRYAHICNECGVGINNYEPKDEPQTVRSNLEPFRVDGKERE